jgi:alpha-L-rhamnosidase
MTTTPESVAAPVQVRDVRAEYHRGRALGIGESRPRVSWITATEISGWFQAAYELEIDGDSFGRIESADSVFVAWPAPSLGSRSAHSARVRVWGVDGSQSAWSERLVLETGLLAPEDWSAQWIAPGFDGEEGRPSYFRRAFSLPEKPDVTIARARLYVTSAGVHRFYLNGQVVGDAELAPGWSAYADRIRYETFDLTGLLATGENVVGAIVADGWWRGNLTWEMKRNVYGDELGLLAQLEVVYSDGSATLIGTDPDWFTASGPLLASDLYNGESYDARIDLDGWSTRGFDHAAWTTAKRCSPKVGCIVAPTAPPVRRIKEIVVQDVIITTAGRTILDFGQNLVGWVRFTVDGEPGTRVTLRHAEVLDAGELGTRPLRNAKATDDYVLRGGSPETWEPAFTFHGFRYVQVDGWPSNQIDPESFRAVVLHSDFEPTGTFSCSNDLLNQFHENVVWGLRGNFVDVPTDCPQRDERLGWTGDLQVFAPTAAFLFDVAGFVADWLEDLRSEQFDDGRVPLVVPAGPPGMFPMGTFAAAAWGDAATIVPWTMYERFGDTAVLDRQFESMRAWVDFVRAKAGERLLWPEEFQLGDWLDPDAPPDQPWRAKTDAVLVATAYFARSAQIVSRAAHVTGRAEAAEEYGQLADAVRRAFRDEFMTPSGLISSDSATAYALAIMFGLYEQAEHQHRAGARIALLSAARGYRISTGFVGTPLVLPALSAAGDTPTAYRLLTETGCPSWLYPVTMGATTVWERWDSMLPDGSINPGEMTSFNHYSLGGVADWMHQTIGGIAPAEPGYRKIRFNPIPGRGVTWASCSFRSPYGPVACRWRLEDLQMTLEVEVPPNTTATVTRPGLVEEALAVTAGQHEWVYGVSDVMAAQWEDPA